MVTVFINLYQQSNKDYSLPANLVDDRYKIECLKSVAPDDGEAICQQGRYSITCPDESWKEVVDKLRLSGKSLIYSVVQESVYGDTIIQQAGELNSKVNHYTTRFGDGKQVFSFWFEECLMAQRYLMAA